MTFGRSFWAAVRLFVVPLTVNLERFIPLFLSCFSFDPVIRGPFHLAEALELLLMLVLGGVAFLATSQNRGYRGPSMAGPRCSQG